MDPQESTTRRFEVTRALPCGGRLTLAGEEAAGRSPGRPLLLLHGLSATRRNVVQGSRHLVRRGYRLIAYDARGHGESDPAPRASAYEYADLVADLEAVLAHFRLERPVLVGSSMGAATALRFALEKPARVAALVQITPAYGGAPRTDGLEDEQWDRMSRALADGGIDAFVEVSTPDGVPPRWRDVTRQATRQRMEHHRHVEAVADALRVVPRSRAFDGLAPLERLDVPVLVVGSRDEADGLHPLAIAEGYARRLPRAELVVEKEGSSPLAWHGARLSRAIEDFLRRSRLGPHE